MKICTFRSSYITRLTQMPSLAYCVVPASAPKIKDVWLQAWRSCARLIPKTASCRAACHLMAVLIERQKVDFSSISDTIDLVLSSVDLHGPADFCDSSAHLWVCVNRLRAQHQPALVQDTSAKTLQWLLARWRPGIIFCVFTL